MPTPASTDHNSTTPLMDANITSLNFIALGSSRASLIFSASACMLKSDSLSSDKPSSVRVRPLATPDKVSKCNIVEARASSGSYKKKRMNRTNLRHVRQLTVDACWSASNIFCTIGLTTAYKKKLCQNGVLNLSRL